MEGIFYIVCDTHGILLFNGHGYTVYQPELMTLDQFLFNGRMFLSHGSAVYFMRKYMSAQHRNDCHIVSQDDLIMTIAERKLDGTHEVFPY